jgi:tetratricopeptide (TPR) repeat protein
MLILRLFLVLCVLGISRIADAASLGELLKNNEIRGIEAALTGVQARFESGQATEIELRDTFRPFYNLDRVSAKNLIAWADSSPNSYVAHLALGIYYKRRGTDARGEKYLAETPDRDIARMAGFYEQAAKELRASMQLTQKPYLSIFHLLTISMQFGDRETSLALLRQANELLPSNSLVRNRYAVSLTPRWGGSYEQLGAFISATKAEDVSTRIVWQLEAIRHDDKGHSLMAQNRQSEAMPNFLIALELGSRVGGTFAEEFLTASRYYVCTGPKKPPSCP